MGIFYPSSAQTLHNQVGDNMVAQNWGQDPRLWLKVQDMVSVGSGVLFKWFLHNSAGTIQF